MCPKCFEKEAEGGRLIEGENLNFVMTCGSTSKQLKKVTLISFVVESVVTDWGITTVYTGVSCFDIPRGGYMLLM